MSNELIITRDLTIEVFDSKKALEDIVTEVKEKVADFKNNYPDITTSKGRKEVTSFVTKVTKTKTGIESLGVERKAHYLEVCKQIDTLRKFAKTELQAQQDYARAPLTEFENKEKERITNHELNISKIEALINDLHHWQELTNEAIEAKKVFIYSFNGCDWQEFKEKAESRIATAIEALESAIEKKTNYDKEQAELAELRKQVEMQRQKDQEERIRRESEEKAKREAELALQREREKAEAEARAAELRIQEEKVRAEREKQEYERKLAGAEAKRIADIEAEKVRAAAEAKEKADEEARREEDKKHVATINGNAAVCLADIEGVDYDAGIKIIEAIADGKIPQVKIYY